MSGDDKLRRLRTKILDCEKMWRGYVRPDTSNSDASHWLGRVWVAGYVVQRIDDLLAEPEPAKPEPIAVNPQQVAGEAVNAGRKLDEAVARAMGWRECLEPVPGWLAPKDNLWPFREVPPYSTDAACIPEMLAWLKAHGWCPELVQYWPTWTWHVDAWQRFEGGKRVNRISECATIHHALACLVLVVAKATYTPPCASSSPPASPPDHA